MTIRDVLETQNRIDPELGELFVDLPVVLSDVRILELFTRVVQPDPKATSWQKRPHRLKGTVPSPSWSDDGTSW